MSFFIIEIYIEIKIYSSISCIIDLRLLTRKDDVILRIFIRNNNVNNHNLFIKIIS